MVTIRTNTSRSVRRAARRGFTLLEIMVVVTIIALLAALVVPRLLGNVDKAKANTAKSELASLAQQIQLWVVDSGNARVPDDFELEMLASGDDRVINMDDLVDPWENPYILVIPGDVNPDFDVMSYGADGQPGGEGVDADLTN